LSLVCASGVTDERRRLQIDNQAILLAVRACGKRTSKRARHYDEQVQTALVKLSAVSKSVLPGRLRRTGRIKAPALDWRTRFKIIEAQVGGGQ
jgi:hypothetical protein